MQENKNAGNDQARQSLGGARRSSRRTRGGRPEKITGRSPAEISFHSPTDLDARAPKSCWLDPDARRQPCADSIDRHVSGPEPPNPSSVPDPPIRKSLPISPKSRLVLAARRDDRRQWIREDRQRLARHTRGRDVPPPSTSSSPRPAQMTSSPPLPRTRSSPARATMTSRWFVPTMSSDPVVPVIVAG